MFKSFHAAAVNTLLFVAKVERRKFKRDGFISLADVYFLGLVDVFTKIL